MPAIRGETGRGRMGTLVAAAAAVNLTTLVAFWALTAVLWHRLPERFPVDFDSRGVPTEWGSPDSGPNWLVLPGIMTGVTVFLAGFLQLVKYLARRQPHWAIPRRKRARGVQLSDEARVRAFRPLEFAIWCIPVPICLLMMYVLWWLFAAFARLSSAPPTPKPLVAAAAAVIAAVLALAAYGALAFRRVVLAELRLLEAECSGTPGPASSV